MHISSNLSELALMQKVMVLFCLQSAISVDSDSSGDDLQQCSKRRKFGQASGSDSDSLLTEVKGLRKEIGQLNKQLPIPFGLRKVLQETFQCCICQSTMTPPIVFGRCCKSLIGCQSCVDRWFQGLMQQTCPKCRAERAYPETCVIKGIDEFLVAIQPLVQPEPPRDEDN